MYVLSDCRYISALQVLEKPKLKIMRLSRHVLCTAVCHRALSMYMCMDLYYYLRPTDLTNSYTRSHLSYYHLFRIQSEKLD